ncbi:MAG: amino acid permease [Acidobacteriota bacterium]
MADHDKGESQGLKQDLGIIGALSIVIGVVLGAGAFMKPAAVMAVAGNSSWALAAWGIGAVLSMAGGLTLCELGVLFPRTGGIYVYLEEIFGSKVAYLYGWMIATTFGPATAGALSGYFGSVFCLLFDIPHNYIPAVSFSVLAFVLFVNSIGVKQAGYLQMLATFSKLVPILLLTVFGLWKGNGGVLNIAGEPTTAPFSIAIIATLFAYDGWAQVASVAGEIKNPSRVLPRAIIGGLIVLSVVYVTINLSLLKVLSPLQITALGHDAAAVASQKLFGLYGGNIITVGIAISILGGINGYLITVSRVLFSMAERGNLPGSESIRQIEPDSKAPVNASMVLVVMAFIYSQIFNPDRLADIAVFAVWIFYMLCFVAVFIARSKFPDMERTYRVPLYPVTPLIAIGGALYIIYGMFSTRPWDAVLSIALTLAGLPILYMLKSKTSWLGLGRMGKKYLILTGSLVLLAFFLVAANVLDTRPILKVAVDSSNPPIAFEGKDGKMAGVDIEIMEAVGHEMGYQLSFIPTSFSHLLVSVEKGLNDVAISEITVTKEREEQVGFSKSYYRGGLAVLVPVDSKAVALSDLAGKSVGVKSRSTGEALASKQAGVTVSSLDVSTDLAMMFAGGKLDAVLFDRSPMEHWIADGTVKGKILNLGKPEEEYAIAFRKGDNEMRDKLNKAIDAVVKRGELEKILQKWSLPENQ